MPREGGLEYSSSVLGISGAVFCPNKTQQLHYHPVHSHEHHAFTQPLCHAANSDQEIVLLVLHLGAFM